MTPVSGPAPIEPPTPDEPVSLPGLEPVPEGFAPPVPSGQAPVLPELPDQAEPPEPADEPPPSPDTAAPEPVLTEPAKAPEAPAIPKLTDSPEYHRLVKHLVQLERRQRAAEKNILILAAALAFVLYQLRKADKPAVVGVEPLAAVPDLPPLDA